MQALTVILVTPFDLKIGIFIYQFPLELTLVL